MTNHDQEQQHQRIAEYFHYSPKAWREEGYLEKFPRAYLDSKKSKQQSKKRQESKPNISYT